MAIDTNESLEMTIEADADAAGKELDELIVKLGEVIAQLKKVKSPNQQGLIPGLQDALGNILDLRKQIAGLNIRRAKFAPDSKGWKEVDAQISEASYQLDKFVTTANDLLGKAIAPRVDTSKIEQAVQDIQIKGLEQTKEDIPLYDGALSPPVEFDWDKFHAENEVHLKEFESFLNGFESKDVGIRVEFTSELAQAQKHVTALENAIERNKHNMRKFQIAGDDARLKREAAALKVNESLLKRYEDAIRAASGAWSHMDDAGTIEIRNVEDFERVERAAKRLEKSIENDTAAMHRFSAANDAAGVERMKAKLEGSIVALDRYNKALNGAANIGKQRDQMRQLENLYADIEKIQKRIATSKGGDQMFVNNTASVRRLKLEMMEAEREVRRLKKALGAADTGGAFRQSAKYIGLSLINMVKLRAEAKRGKKAVIDMSRALSLMAFRMAIRIVMRLTREGIENLAKYSREVDNAFNGSVSRMMSKVTELKNSFAAAVAPVIQAIEPYVVRIANFLIDVFNQLSLLMASLFGQKTFYKAIPVTEDYAESLDTAANSAKKLQKQLMGIDELTVLQDPNAGASGATPGKADPSEMFTVENVADHAEDLQNIKDNLAEILPYAVGIGTALAAWHIAPAVINGVETVSKLAKILGGKPLQIAGGSLLVGAGGLLEGFSIADAIKNDLNGLNFAGILGGGGTLTAGAALIGKALGSTIIGAAVGGIVAGIPMFVTGVYDAFKNGLNTLNALLIPAGAAAAGAGIGAIIGSLGGPIGTGVGALIGLAIGGLTDLIMYGFNDAIPAVDLFGKEISDVTREKLEPFFEKTQDLRVALAGLEYSGQIIDDATVSDVRAKVAEIASIISTDLATDKEASIADLSALEGHMGTDEFAKIQAATVAYYDQAQKDLESHKARISEIMQTAAEDGRSITEQEWAEINRIQSEMQDLGIRTLTESEVEYETVMRNLKDNTTRLSLDQASEIIKNAQTARDETIAAAENQYSTILLRAEQLREAGAINDEEYQTMIDAAKEARDSTVADAEEQYKGIYDAAVTNLGDMSKYIDEETGDIKTKWDVFCEDIGLWWDDALDRIVENVSGLGDDIKESLSETWKDLKEWWSKLELPEFKIKTPHISWSSKPAEGWIADVLSALGLPTSIPKLKVNWYAGGGFPSMGELFVARERGPELVGRMGSRNVVANNDQIVQGIAYGVAEANDALIAVAYAVADRVVQAINDKDMNTYIDTKKITTAQQNRSRAYGV